MKKKKKRTAKPFKVQKDLDRILASLNGKVDYTFDHQRTEELVVSPQALSVAGNRELFNRLCRRDFHYLRNLPVLAAERILPLLLPQSIWGRARNGHGMFCDERGRSLMFPDASFENVITGIGTEDWESTVERSKAGGRDCWITSKNLCCIAWRRNGSLSARRTMNRAIHWE